MLFTWRVLRRGQRGHGVGQVEVGSDAELALAGGRVRRGGCPQLLLPPLLVGRRQVAVDQRVQELDDQLSIVWDLSLLVGGHKGRMGGQRRGKRCNYLPLTLCYLFLCLQKKEKKKKT